MSKKLTIEEIKEKLSLINPDIEILSNEYVNNKGKLNVRCKIDGYLWESSWSNLSKGKGCKKCAGILSPTIEFVKEEISKINPNIELLSDTYINNNSPLECKCLIDGYKWSSSWSRLRKNHGCPKCAGNVKLGLDTIKDFLDKNDSTFELFGENSYKNAKSKLKLKCKIDGHEWEASWDVINKGHGCPMCCKRPRITLDIIKERMKDIDENIEILEENVYKNAKTNLKLKCLLDGNLWEASWTNLKQGHGCPICRRRFFQESTIEKNKDKWSKMYGSLYIIRCTGMGESFYKVGITRKNVKSRFKNSNMGYKYEMIFSINKNWYEIVKLESMILKEFNNSITQYEPSVKFGGYTECFDLSSFDLVMEIIDGSRI